MLNKKNKTLGLILCLLSLFSFTSFATSMQQPVKETMKRATRVMTDTVSYEGGYVWSYLPDFSRRWGEMEAKLTMVWVQPPGTATMGHLFLDAYHATQDIFYYQAAQQVADALIKGQHSSGGWNYMFDLAGEESLQNWYNTIGKNGWRLEEFHHHYGNATFDDEGTFEAGIFLLRLYKEKHDKQYLPALTKVINFVLDSQYDMGGWPQRYPPAEAHSVQGQQDYSRFITFNDGVANTNMRFLLFCAQALDDNALHKRIDVAIERGMNAFITLKLPAPQPGWALQYSLDLKPAAARSYEPVSVSVGTTVNNLSLLMHFYKSTGDKKYLDGIEQTLGWLASLRLPDALIRDGRTHPRMVEIGSNKPLFVHRRGSNVNNGEYFVDYEATSQVSHYPSTGRVDIEALRTQYSELKTQADNLVPVEKISHPLPRFFISSWYITEDAKTGKVTEQDKISDKTVANLINQLNQQGYWPSSLPRITNPYIGAKLGDQATETSVDYSTSRVGDKFDTSPYKPKQAIPAITLKKYLENMATFVNYIEQHND
ncbi:pectate lyase [uncultured Paraglaciecola sp.]|uniref:pectate lyase n=1 Tax=uncultured Paraglaciecola sp. TaxID=1765024 RepID=UPI0025CF538B|nr:pectate lyase [uncultured Paraglaciecola sp.]